jgi:AbrB family looped-hinge helix DNA binding protein
MNMHSPIGVRVAANGRLVLPKAARVALGVEGEGVVVLRIEDGAVVISSVRADGARAQALYRAHVKNDLPSDEILQTRREEAAKDRAEEL